MRIDVLTIFPAYLDALHLSLVGKARADGLLDVAVHDLRDWTTDRHRTVDDTPFGGGAGMVMRPDVWGRALDDVLGAGPDGGAGPAVLVVPTPAGETLTQALAAELAGADHLAIACGRYEGIDARVVDSYAARPGVVVREVSIGDYVLGGGEVAALVLVEAVARLLPGVIGNPASLDEESHGAAGLLEYPVYTKPPEWSGLAVPEVLTSGHHARVDRWRRDRALERTARRRPDLVAALDPAALDDADRAVLAGAGWYASRPAGPSVVTVHDAGAPALRRAAVRPAGPHDAGPLAALAALTFPLACPPSLDAAAIADFVAAHLGHASFAGYLADPGRILVLAEEEIAPGVTRAVGYAMLVLASPPPDGPGGTRPAELSKCYVHPDHHGNGLADRLLMAVVGAARDREIDLLWLGTNVANRRAQRFYARHGFARTGRRRFVVGGQDQDDVVLATDLAPR